MQETRQSRLQSLLCTTDCTTNDFVRTVIEDPLSLSLRINFKRSRVERDSDDEGTEKIVAIGLTLVVQRGLTSAGEVGVRTAPNNLGSLFRLVKEGWADGVREGRKNANTPLQ